MEARPVISTGESLQQHDGNLESSLDQQTEDENHTRQHDGNHESSLDQHTEAESHPEQHDGNHESSLDQHTDAEKHPEQHDGNNESSLDQHTEAANHPGQHDGCHESLLDQHSESEYRPEQHDGNQESSLDQHTEAGSHFEPSNPLLVGNQPSSSEERLSSGNGGEIQDFDLEMDDDLSKDTQCGIGIFKGPLLQRFATKNTYIFCYGILGLVNSASWAYFNGTINTMEKRFKIPSKVLGLMNLGTNTSQLFMSTVLGYWAGRGHRPRWIAFSIVMSILQMVMTLVPHAIYGPGSEALALTEEYGENFANITLLPLGEQTRHLCGGEGACVDSPGSFAQPAILFVARFIGGIGGGLFYTAGISYIDDNIKKSQSPFLISLSITMRMLGPSVGYAVASLCLKFYIAPTLTPTITTEDPRWLGAWWIGWIVFIIGSSILVIPFFFFPKILPATAAKIRKEGRRTQEPPASVRGLIASTRRLLSNKLYLYNTLASVMYILGSSAYWYYLSKYIETQYRQSASASNFATGTVSLLTSSTGMLVSGYVIGKIRPTARQLALWNVLIAILCACGSIVYIFIDCGTQISTNQPTEGFNTTLECNAHCGCDNVPYSPVCSQYNETYLSACHAGCLGQEERDGTKMFTNCSCIDDGKGIVTPGLCPFDCIGPLRIFLIVLCTMELASYSGVASNFLVGVRCVDEKDKSAAMGLGLTLMGIFGFAPAPVIFGYIIDLACIVWGKTCQGSGNCWLYDSAQLAYTINLTSAAFTSIGAVFDIGVWYHCKNLKIFDDDKPQASSAKDKKKNWILLNVFK